MKRYRKHKRRATILLMVVGLLAMLFIIVSAYITLARFDRIALSQVRKANDVDQIVDSINDVTLAVVQKAWSDGEGHLLSGGWTEPPTPDNPNVPRSDVAPDYLAEDIPGFSGARFLASNEPVRDVNAVPVNPNTVLWPLELYTQVVSALDNPLDTGGDPLKEANRYPLAGLFREDPFDMGAGMFNLDAQDIGRNAQQPFMDADGDGIPDTYFVHTTLLTDMANALVGVPARAPGLDSSNNPVVNPGRIPDPTLATVRDTQVAAWADFESSSRYDVAFRVVSHGGMVALSSPGQSSYSYAPWNRSFVTEMFNWVRHRRDGSRLLRNDDALFNEVANASAAIEPHLRRRGGLLSLYPHAEQFGGSRVPAALAELEDTFRRTFIPTFQRGYKDDSWQRFNVASIVQDADGGEWTAWTNSVSLDPDAYNLWAQGLGGSDPTEYYGRRHLITTASSSDDLARELDPRSPSKDLVESLGSDMALGTYPGQLKFYLGEISDAFDGTGNYLTDIASGNGNKVVARLADYYYEMLGAHDGWGGLDLVGGGGGGGGAPPGTTEAVSRRQQAFMLAVNTVAFAAPWQERTRPGFIDVVWYRDTFDGRTYVGYSPQPFFTQVIAHNEGEDDDPLGTDPPDGGDVGGAGPPGGNPGGGPGGGGGEGEEFTPTRIALGIELFYPHDADPDVTTDPTLTRFDNALDSYALDLNAFFITINDADPSVPANRVFLSEVGGNRLSGRNFISLSIHGGNNSSLSAYCDGTISDLPVEVYPPSGPGFGGGGESERRRIEVKLWRLNSTNVHFLVDEIIVTPDRLEEEIPTDGAEPWLINVRRDTNPALYFGGDWNADGLVEAPARWRMATNVVSAQFYSDSDGDDVDGLIDTVGPALGSALPASSGFAPDVPLYTMNAYPQGANEIHGSLRPRSFPTAGFLLYVPRFSHVTSKPMSEILRMQWEDVDQREYQLRTYPADFGHMPIFDNVQQTQGEAAGESEGYFSPDRAGKVPWGMLVFDYFTTLNPKADLDRDGQPDVDPRRIPGRINVNTAPWYVLAGLPVLDPGQHMDRTSSPAFRSRKSGVVQGLAPYPGSATYVERFETGPAETSRLIVGPDAQTGWYRLGGRLAQAVAAHRDKTRYVGTEDVRLVNAHTRTRLAGGTTRSYGTLRQRPGFTSLGELVNVAGFDGRRLQDGGLVISQPLDLQDPSNPGVEWMPDYFKAVSLLAMLDTHFLTTRSHTFTVYASVMDRENPQASIRSQITVDRSNLLPKLLLDERDLDGDDDATEPLLYDTDGDGIADWPVIIYSNDQPEIISQREVSYFNARFDE